MGKEGLQLGNIVKVENLYDTAKIGTYRSVSIESLSEESAVISLMDGSSAPLDCIEGISLTEEVLECTNIERNRSTSYKLIDSLELRASGQNKYYLASNSAYYGLLAFTNVKIKYLNELQNLYYLIMGKELIVDIEKLNSLNKQNGRL